MSEISPRRFHQLGLICAGEGSRDQKLKSVAGLSRGNLEEEWMRVAAIALITDPTTVALALQGDLREGIFLVAPKSGKSLAVTEAISPIRNKLAKSISDFHPTISPGKNKVGNSAGFSCLVVGFSEDIKEAGKILEGCLTENWKVDLVSERVASGWDCLMFVDRMAGRMDPERLLGPVRDREEENARFLKAGKDGGEVDQMVWSALRR